MIYADDVFIVPKYGQNMAKTAKSTKISWDCMVLHRRQTSIIMFLTLKGYIHNYSTFCFLFNVMIQNSEAKFDFFINFILKGTKQDRQTVAEEKVPDYTIKI